jgi:hypothetical protein
LDGKKFIESAFAITSGKLIKTEQLKLQGFFVFPFPCGPRGGWETYYAGNSQEEKVGHSPAGIKLEGMSPDVSQFLRGSLDEF